MRVDSGFLALITGSQKRLDGTGGGLLDNFLETYIDSFLRFRLVDKRNGMLIFSPSTFTNLTNQIRKLIPF